MTIDAGTLKPAAGGEEHGKMTIDAGTLKPAAGGEETRKRRPMVTARRRRKHKYDYWEINVEMVTAGGWASYWTLTSLPPHRVTSTSRTGKTTTKNNNNKRERKKRDDRQIDIQLVAKKTYRTTDER